MNSTMQSEGKAFIISLLSTVLRDLASIVRTCTLIVRTCTLIVPGGEGGEGKGEGYTYNRSLYINEIVPGVQYNIAPGTYCTIVPGGKTLKDLIPLMALVAFWIMSSGIKFKAKNRNTVTLLKLKTVTKLCYGKLRSLFLLFLLFCYSCIKMHTFAIIRQGGKYGWI